MAKQWIKTDYTSPLNPENAGKGVTDAESLTTTYDEEELELLALKFNGRKRPSEFVASLRKLAKEGRKYLEELEASRKEEPFSPVDEGPPSSTVSNATSE